MKKIFLSLLLLVFVSFSAGYHNDDATANAQETSSLTLLSPTNEETFSESTVTVSFIVEGLTIGVGMDHLHYYLDDEGVVMVYDTEDIVLEDLSEGEHTLTLVVADDDHIDSTDTALSQTVTFTVSILSYEEPPQRTVTLMEIEDHTLYYETVQVAVEVDGTTVGEDYNHLHYYVDDVLHSMVYDTESWELSNLDEGEHTLKVVLAYTDHSEYDETDLTDSVTFRFYEAAGEPTFSDVDSDHENYAAIQYLVSVGTLQGYSDGTFQPDKTVNRAELMKILVAGQQIDPDESLYQNCFPDVTTDWYAKYVCYAYEEGWVSGYPDGDFKPAQTVNKVEAVKMIVNAFGLDDTLPDSVSEELFDDTDNSQWYAPYLYVAKAMGFLEVDSGDYEPSGDLNRGWVSEYVFRGWVVQEMSAESFDLDLRDEFFWEEEFKL